MILCIALLETMCCMFLESATVQMGFCMETAGMTQGLQTETDSVEDPELRDENESMDDDQDREVEGQLRC